MWRYTICKQVLTSVLLIFQAKEMGYEALINENTVFNLLRSKPPDNIIKRIFLAQCNELAFLGLEFING